VAGSYSLDGELSLDPPDDLTEKAPSARRRDVDSPSATAAGLDRALTEVTIQDEPDVFLEVIKFVYMNTCHVEQANVKALIQAADRYGVEDIIRMCLQWIHENFTPNLFYSFFTFSLLNEKFQQLVWQTLLFALRSRRHFMLVTEDAAGRWEQIPVCFVEALLSLNELPVVSEAEVLQLLSRWASGKLSALREQQMLSNAQQGETEATCTATEQCTDDRKGSDADCDCPAAQGSPKSSSGVSAIADATVTGGEDSAGTPATGSLQEGKSDMLRLLRTLRKSDMSIKIGELDPILELLQLHTLFSSKPPRECTALDPGFIVYRGVAGVNMPTPFGAGLSQPDVLQHAWKGRNVTLGCHDFLQQQDGFKVSCSEAQTREGDGLIIFPRLRVSIECHAWSHREKRSLKASAGHGRPPPAIGRGGDESSMSSTLAPVTEAGTASVPLPAAPSKNAMASCIMQSQDDSEIGRPVRTTGLGPPLLDVDSRRNPVPNFGDHEKIDHKVNCAVVSGHVRHGIRIGQRERSSIYEVEELNGQCDEVFIGGSPTEVEFELQLIAQAPNVCGIFRCSLAVLPTGTADDQASKALMEMLFDASAEEQMSFHISSSHFDSNSSYIVSLNWSPGHG